MLWNMLTGEYTDLVGLVHPGIMRGQFTPSLALPMSPFTLSSGFLGLLLGMYVYTLSLDMKSYRYTHVLYHFPI